MASTSHNTGEEEGRPNTPHKRNQEKREANFGLVLHAIRTLDQENV